MGMLLQRHRAAQEAQERDNIERARLENEAAAKEAQALEEARVAEAAQAKPVEAPSAPTALSDEDARIMAELEAEEVRKGDKPGSASAADRADKRGKGK